MCRIYTGEFIEYNGSKEARTDRFAHMSFMHDRPLGMSPYKAT